MQSLLIVVTAIYLFLGSSINTFIVIGTSLGGLIVLLSPVVIIIIVATIAKRKGLFIV